MAGKCTSLITPRFSEIRGRASRVKAFLTNPIAVQDQAARAVTPVAAPAVRLVPLSPPPSGTDYAITSLLHLHDHFRSVFAPMAFYSTLVPLACKLSQLVLAKVGSPETGPPLVIAASVFCYRFNENNLPDTYTWTSVVTGSYLVMSNFLLPKNTSRLGLTLTRATVIATALFTYMSQTDPATSSIVPAPLGFKAYMADAGVKARIAAWKQRRPISWFKLS